MRRAPPGTSVAGLIVGVTILTLALPRLKALYSADIRVESRNTDVVLLASEVVPNDARLCPTFSIYAGRRESIELLLAKQSCSCFAVSWNQQVLRPGSKLMVPAGEIRTLELHADNYSKTRASELEVNIVIDREAAPKWNSTLKARSQIIPDCDSLESFCIVRRPTEQRNARGDIIVRRHSRSPADVAVVPVLREQDGIVASAVTPRGGSLNIRGGILRQEWNVTFEVGAAYCGDVGTTKALALYIDWRDGVANSLPLTLPLQVTIRD